MNYWLLKTEPETYSWATLANDGHTVWDGVRNYQARNFLRQMIEGDKALFYHSGKEKQVVGICSIVKGPYPEKGQEANNWVVVEVAPAQLLENPVTLKSIKNVPTLSKMLLIRHTRLSVMPISSLEFHTIIELSKK